MQNVESAHLPPSRLRYEAAHPTITIRVSRQDYERLTYIRRTTGKSFAGIFKEAARIQQASAWNAYDQGFQAAKAQFAVTCKCRVCGEDIAATQEAQKKELGEHLGKMGLIHGRCVKKTRQSQTDIQLGSYSYVGPSGAPITRTVYHRPDGSNYSTPR